MVYGPNVLLAFLGAAGVLIIALGVMAIPRYNLSPGRDDAKGFLARLQGKIDQADLKISAMEFLSTATLLGMGLGFAAFALTGAIAAGLFGVGLGFLGYWSYLDDRRAKRRRDYQEALAETVDILREGFAASNTLNAALHIVAEHAPAVVRSDFQEVVAAESLGQNFVDALYRVAERRRDVMLDRIVEALTLGKEEGGSINAILAVLGQSIRALASARRRIATSQTRVRWEARIVCLAPFSFLVILRQTAPDLIEPFLASIWGQGAVIVIGLMSGLAYQLMNRIGQRAIEPMESVGIAN
ncbi:MAG: type II secretion system F family protein [Chloroflexi bacterium]|nr:type II secretion system F family protein [Chloroflexota bacterium]